MTIDSTPPRPRDPYEAFFCDDLHRAHYGTSSHVEAISHSATLRGQRQDVYSKTVKSSCSPATQGSTITGRCRRFEGRVRSQSLSSHVEAISHPATLRGQRQDVYSKTVKSSCSPATQGSTITGRCRRVRESRIFVETSKSRPTHARLRNRELADEAELVSLSVG